MILGTHFGGILIFFSMCCVFYLQGTEVCIIICIVYGKLVLSYGQQWTICKHIVILRLEDVSHIHQEFASEHIHLLPNINIRSTQTKRKIPQYTQHFCLCTRTAFMLYRFLMLQGRINTFCFHHITSNQENFGLIY